MTQYPGYIVPTGDFIKEWMEDNDINGAELSRRLDVSRKHVSELLHGKAPLSHEMALKLEYVTGVPARIWNLHEAGYREALARQRSEQDLVNQYERASDFPLAYLRNCGFITAAPRDKTRTVQQLLQFFGLGTLDAFQPTWEKSAVAYRRSAIGREDVCALATWLHVAERTAALDSLPDYSRSTMEAALPELRSLTIGEPSEAIREAQRHLRDCGVALALVPAVRGLGIHGATRWLHGHPLIQLSGLWKSDDQLWFTLFHEIAHVLLHDPKGLYLADAGNAAEEEADEYAMRLLVPKEHEAKLPAVRNLAEVQRLAEELKVAPSIVLGQAQRRTGDYAWGHKLKRKVDISAIVA